jgi:hypothetical protein
MVGRNKIFGNIVHLKRNLTWKAHIKSIENKAMQGFVAVYSIFKCGTLNRKLKTRLNKSLIRAILLHGAMRPKTHHEAARYSK